MRHEFEKEFDVYLICYSNAFDRNPDGTYKSGTVEDAWKEYQEKHKGENKVSEFLK